MTTLDYVTDYSDLTAYHFYHFFFSYVFIILTLTDLLTILVHSDLTITVVFDLYITDFDCHAYITVIDLTDYTLTDLYYLSILTLSLIITDFGHLTITVIIFTDLNINICTFVILTLTWIYSILLV